MTIFLISKTKYIHSRCNIIKLLDEPRGVTLGIISPAANTTSLLREFSGIDTIFFIKIGLAV